MREDSERADQVLERLVAIRAEKVCFRNFRLGARDLDLNLVEVPKVMARTVILVQNEITLNRDIHVEYSWHPNILKYVTSPNILSFNLKLSNRAFSSDIDTDCPTQSHPSSYDPKSFC